MMVIHQPLQIHNTELLFPAVLTIFRPNYHHRFEVDYGDYNFPDNYIMKDFPNKFEKKHFIFNNPLIENCLSVCRKNKTELYLYTAPMYQVNVTTDTTLDNYFNFSNIYIHASMFSDNIHIAHKTTNDFTTKLTKLF